MTYRLIHGEAIATLKAAKTDSVHAIVCDPPYAIEFMGKGWDNPKMLGMSTGYNGGPHNIPPGTHRPDISKNDPQLFQQWCTAWGEAALRVLKPGGHLLAFGSPRTYHRLAAGLEDAGFEIRDTIMWLYGEGMPKGKDLTVEIDKLLGVEREVVGETDGAKTEEGIARWNEYRHGKYAELTGKRDVTVPTSEEAKLWDGWSTCLKPMHEPIVVARKQNAPGTTKTGRVSKKPMTNAQNLVEHGVGAMNLAACAVGDEQLNYTPKGIKPGSNNAVGAEWDGGGQQPVTRKGRMPGNVILDAAAAEQVDAEAHKARTPSRFFYCAKAKPKEKTAGLEGKNPHPTVKPLALMEYLVRLVTPEGGVVLDPFMGSGTTGIAALTQGFNFVGIELDESYVAVAHQRIAHHAPEAAGQVVTGVLPVLEPVAEVPETEGCLPPNVEIEQPEMVVASETYVDSVTQQVVDVTPAPSFDIHCSQGDCGVGIDLGRPATEEEKALAWNCGPCATKLVPA